MNERQPLTGQSSSEGLHSSKSSSGLSSSDLDHARRLLYISHAFNQFSEGAWQFCVALFLAAFTNNTSLILVTSYGLVTYSFVCVFGSSIGRYIDKSNRLTVARKLIGFENLAVVTATFMCYRLLSEDHSESLYNKNTLLLLVSIHFLGAVAMILDSGFLVAVERDWVVVMSIVASKIQSRGSVTTKEEEKIIQSDWLSDTNVKMRQIDLSCKILAPAVSGLYIALLSDGTSGNGYDLRGATLMVGGINTAALIAEYICTAKIYHQIPELASKSADKTGESCSDAESSETDTTRGEEEQNTIMPKFLEGLTVYFSQSICWAGFALALLYLNVALTFGNITTVYLVWRGIGMEEIGLWRGIASAMGLAGTFVYHIMAQKICLIDVGMISVTFEFLFLAICFSSLFVHDNQLFFIIFIGGLILSRIGLWVFDIAVTQLMQLHIPAPIRGLVGGVQQSLNAFFTVLIYTVGLFISDPENFIYFALFSFGGVALAAIFYGVMVFPRRRMFVSDALDDNKNSTV